MIKLFDILKAEKTGLSNSVYTSLLAKKLSGGSAPTVKELEGAPPLTFTAIGEPLIDWHIDGNMTQTTPITPSECGERTDNLYNYQTVVIGKYINAEGEETPSAGMGDNLMNHTDYISITSGESYYFKIRKTYNSGAASNAFCWFDSNKNIISRDLFDIGSGNYIYATYTAPQNAAYLIVNFRGEYYDTGMLNIGNTAAEFEPYGFKLPIVCGGETKTIYIGSNPLRKSLDGTAVDTLSSTGTLTRRVDTDGSVLATPTTESVTVPSIPTVDGSNTFNVNTTVAPSNAYIKYKG